MSPDNKVLRPARYESCEVVRNTSYACIWDNLTGSKNFILQHSMLPFQYPPIFLHFQAFH